MLARALAVAPPPFRRLRLPAANLSAREQGIMHDRKWRCVVVVSSLINGADPKMALDLGAEEGALAEMSKERQLLQNQVTELRPKVFYQ